MSADTDRSLPDSRPLHRLISRAGALLRSAWVATGLGVTVGLLLGFLAVLSVIDLFVPFEPVALFGVVVPLDPVFRCVALVLVTVPAALALFHGVLRPLARRLGPVQVARRIEDRLPGIHNRLVSAIDLETKGEKENVSRHFLARLLGEALARIKGFRVSSLLDLVSLRNAVLAALIAVAVSAAAWAAFSDRLPTALARIFFPFADIPPASGVRYAVEPGDKNLLVGEKVRFAARLLEGETSKLRVVVYGKAGTEPRGFALEQDKVDGHVFANRVGLSAADSPFREGFTYRVFGGGTWSKLHKVKFVERPVVASAKAFTRLPAYARIDKLAPVADQATVTGIENGAVVVRVQGKGDVAEGEIQLLEPALARLPADKQEEQAWYDDAPPGGTSTGGNWEWTKHRRRPVHTEPPSIGTYGHWFQEDPKGLRVGRGDVLFAWVFVPENRKPAMIALEWHDGAGWEHRAFWGLDKLRDGKLGTPSRLRMGDVPAAGEWVRLEVPAAKLGLEGKTLKGMGFKLHDGQAFWGRAGTVRVEADSFKVVKSHPLKAQGENLWEGEFPLVGTGKFRVELRSPEGYASETQAERDFKALPDLPPAVALSLPSVQVDRPKGLPLAFNVDAADDVGIDVIRLKVRPATGGEWKVRELFSAKDKPLVRKAVPVQIKEFAALKPGDGLRLLAEVADTKGQVAKTEEYTIRVALDAVLETKMKAADKERDAFLEKLAQLMAKQKKLTERMAELEQEYAEIGKKVDKLRDEGKRPDGKPLDDASKTDPAGSKERGGLTPDELKKLADLQKELAKLGAEEDKHAAEAGALGNELKKMADDAGKDSVLPPEFADAVKDVSNLFDKVVRDAMRDIGKKLKDQAAPDKGSPDLKGDKRDGEKLDADLKGIKDRLEGVKDAKD
ncbi:MAG: hypothetical protein K2W96_10235, partial [Gemmataceae bacterium]|nr:hypothetical protein [Gemmataceae bacterium]